MTDVFWNDLQPLKDILDEIEPPNTVVNDKDIEDFKESVCYIVDDVINQNITFIVINILMNYYLKMYYVM